MDPSVYLKSEKHVLAHPGGCLPCMAAAAQVDSKKDIESELKAAVLVLVLLKSDMGPVRI